jgi:hypothetical protein
LLPRFAIDGKENARGSADRGEKLPQFAFSYIVGQISYEKTHGHFDSYLICLQLTLDLSEEAKTSALVFLDLAGFRTKGAMRFFITHVENVTEFRTHCKWKDYGVSGRDWSGQTRYGFTNTRGIQAWKRGAGSCAIPGDVFSTTGRG